MLKSFIHLWGILMITLFSTASICNKSDDTQLQSPSLIGKWQLSFTEIDAIKLDGEVFNFSDPAITGNPVYWEFFDNGIMKASEGNSAPVESNWELKIERLTPDGLGIDKGKLTLTGSYADQVKTALELESLVYSVERSGGSDNFMTLYVKPNNLSSSFSEVTISYLYLKI